MTLPQPPGLPPLPPNAAAAIVGVGGPPAFLLPLPPPAHFVHQPPPQPRQPQGVEIKGVVVKTEPAEASTEDAAASAASIPKLEAKDVSSHDEIVKTEYPGGKAAVPSGRTILGISPDNSK